MKAFFSDSQGESLLNAFGENLVIVQDGESIAIKAMFEQDEIFFEGVQVTITYFTAKSGLKLNSTFSIDNTEYKINRIEDDLSGISNYYYIKNVDLREI